MTETIRAILENIEEKEQVRILYSVESGSRAWGFASSDSDYDVRFIYVRCMEDYLRLDSVRDVIEWQLDETLDVNGWDLQKALRLLHASNPTLFEWTGSPVVYRTTPEWEALRSLIDASFLSGTGLQHYRHMASRNYREYLKGDMVPLKKYLYVLRSILACRWILKKRTSPPVQFQELADAELEPSLRSVVEELLERKRNTPETGLVPRITVLNDYIERELASLESAAASMEKDQPVGYETLNKAFLAILRGAVPK